MEQNAHQAQIPHQQNNQTVRVSAKEFAAKFQSKRECYTFLAVENQVCLPPYGKCSQCDPIKPLGC